jgi:hypothetical protein
MKRGVEKSFMGGLRGNTDWKGFSNLLPHSLLLTELNVDVTRLKIAEKEGPKNDDEDECESDRRSEKF